jgi:hypothetical protein
MRLADKRATIFIRLRLGRHLAAIWRAIVCYDYNLQVYFFSVHTILAFQRVRRVAILLAVISGFLDSERVLHMRGRARCN